MGKFILGPPLPVRTSLTPSEPLRTVRVEPLIPSAAASHKAGQHFDQFVCCDQRLVPFGERVGPHIYRLGLCFGNCPLGVCVTVGLVLSWPQRRPRP